MGHLLFHVQTLLSFPKYILVKKALCRILEHFDSIFLAKGKCGSSVMFSELGFEKLPRMFPLNRFNCQDMTV